MKGTDFKGSTFNLIKPENMTDEQCSSLPAAKGVTQDGYPFILVAFQPSEEDIIAMQSGGKIFMQVLGDQFAPVSLFTIDANGNIND